MEQADQIAVSTFVEYGLSFLWAVVWPPAVIFAGLPPPATVRATTQEVRGAGHHLPHVDLAGRLRRRAGPEPRGPTGQAGAGAARLAHRRPASQRCRQGRERVAHAPAGRVCDGAEHVRPDSRGLGWGMDRVVGPRTAVSRAGVRADPSRT